MILDLHVHSKYSKDSRLEPEKILKLATAKGLGGIAVTDHNTVYGGLIARKVSKGDLLVIVGSEIKTERGEVMGLFLNEEIPERSFFDVVDAIRDQGGIVVLPHPFDRLRRSSFLKIREECLNFIDCIEVFNSRCIRGEFNHLAESFAALHNLPVTAGSDAHLANEIGLAGIMVNADEEEEVRKAILKKEVRIFGRKSSILNHGITKVLKIWRHLKDSGP
uniref:PHP domain-containing protein n=1 Tax=Fervidobacterium pennivorans TaxID=93466 RepID=A0A7V4KEF3_FERPE